MKADLSQRAADEMRFVLQPRKELFLGIRIIGISLEENVFFPWKEGILGIQTSCLSCSHSRFLLRKETTTRKANAYAY